MTGGGALFLFIVCGFAAVWAYKAMHRLIERRWGEWKTPSQKRKYIIATWFAVLGPLFGAIFIVGTLG